VPLGCEQSRHGHEVKLVPVDNNMVFFTRTVGQEVAGELAAYVLPMFSNVKPCFSLFGSESKLAASPLY
jgi:hypothetical protein